MSLQGLDKCVQNLNKEIIKIRGRTLKGLIRGNIIIRRSIDTTPPLVPVDTGNLRLSYYCVSVGPHVVEGASPTFQGKGAGRMASVHSKVISSALTQLAMLKDPAIIIGFTAEYAWPVHESVGKHFRRPGSGAKYFQASLLHNRENILRVITEEARIP